LQSTFYNIGVSKSQKQKEIKGDGAKLIKETNEYLLYEIYNHEASCYYGSGTRWCITGKNPNNPEGGSQSWDGYTRDGASFMFLIRKNGDINDIHYKVAIAYKDKDKVRYILAAFDALDEQIDKTKLKSITKSVDNNWDYIYFENKTWVGYVPIEIMSTEDILNKVVDGSYIIQSDGTADVNGNVNMDFNKLTEIPVKFGKVTGDFYCDNNQLTSLEGAPQSVGDSFICYDNQLTSLMGAPKSVGDSFYCHNNRLTNLEGAPQSIVGSFDCSNNQLTSLIGAPKSVGGDFDCKSNRIKFTEDDVRAVSDVKGRIIL
jgi:hypothetical protein